MPDNGTGPWALALAPFRYAWPVDHLIRRLKFHGERPQARLFGSLLGRHRAALMLPMPELIVPVPLHARRLRERGFNQAADLATFAARELRLPCAKRALRRVRATHEQSALPAIERSANVEGAFEATLPLNGKHIALVDDVLTTGSTARAATAALLARGAAVVELWVVARAGDDVEAPPDEYSAAG